MVLLSCSVPAHNLSGDSSLSARGRSQNTGLKTRFLGTPGSEGTCFRAAVHLPFVGRKVCLVFWILAAWCKGDTVPINF